MNFLTPHAALIEPIDEAQIFCYHDAAFSTKLSTSWMSPGV